MKSIPQPTGHWGVSYIKEFDLNRHSDVMMGNSINSGIVSDDSKSRHDVTKQSQGLKKWSKKYGCCVKCKTTRIRHYAKGLCKKCYKKGYIYPTIVCKKCKQKKEHESKGLCRRCYKKQWQPKKTICKRCRQVKNHHGKGLCKDCYQKQWKSKIIICMYCKEKKNHYAKGLCNKCWQRKRIGIDEVRSKELEDYKKGIRWSPRHKKCIECGTTEKRHWAKGLCRSCYDKKFGTKTEKYYEAKKRYYKSEKCKETREKYCQTEAYKVSLRKYNSKRRLQLKGFVYDRGISVQIQGKIIERDKVCVYCEGLLENIDHIQAIHNGGHNDFNNLVGACKSCNSSKGKKDVFEWCNNKGIDVPGIVIKLLRKQNEQRTIYCT